jgi:hypothetical protein
MFIPYNKNHKIWKVPFNEQYRSFWLQFANQLKKNRLISESLQTTDLRGTILSHYGGHLSFIELLLSLGSYCPSVTPQNICSTC